MKNRKEFHFIHRKILVEWQWKSHIPGFYECPDLVKLQVTNRPGEFKWILFDGDGSYLIGVFDGETIYPGIG
ncbi:MAG: hypothetical protein MZV63_28575 [Marinilabiliales bacterium]|nr:hypothetical protein [Marinilabiliales bacterium]